MSCSNTPRNATFKTYIGKALSVSYLANYLYDMSDLAASLDELGLGEDQRIGRKRCHEDEDDDRKYKSKNLNTERARRKKLNDRLLMLRGLVPNITNMKKSTIVEDAITYVMELQQTVDTLQDQLLDMEASSEEAPGSKNEESRAAKEIKKFSIQAEVHVTQLCGRKLLVKVFFEKKIGGFTKLMEAVGALGFELTDTSVTTFDGAMLVTTCLEGFFYDEQLPVEELKDMLLDMINSI
ncbi:hypothetical protein UlMin_011638 [Ulmus minor]